VVRLDLGDPALFRTRTLYHHSPTHPLSPFSTQNTGEPCESVRPGEEEPRQTKRANASPAAAQHTS